MQGTYPSQVPGCICASCTRVVYAPPVPGWVYRSLYHGGCTAPVPWWVFFSRTMVGISFSRIMVGISFFLTMVVSSPVPWWVSSPVPWWEVYPGWYGGQCTPGGRVVGIPPCVPLPTMVDPSNPSWYTPPCHPGYTTGYTPHPGPAHPAAHGVPLSRDEALGSTWEKPVGENLFSSLRS